MKCDHVVNVTVLEKRNTIVSSIRGPMNPLVLVKSQILSSNLDSKRKLNELKKCNFTEQFEF